MIGWAPIYYDATHADNVHGNKWEDGKSPKANVWCSIAVSYQNWIMNAMKWTDEHLRICSHFLTMSGDFLEFVSAYQCQDITIENGYLWFAPGWKILGQCKYLEAYLKQLNCILKMNWYSCLEEIRRNKYVRTYRGCTGKLALAHNEWLELNKKEFALYPSVRMLEGMSQQRQFISLTQKAKQVVETIYSSGPITKRIFHQSGTGLKGNCTAKKQLINEVIWLFLGNLFDVANGHRRLDSAFMMTLQPFIKTQLNRTRLERRRLRLFNMTI